MVPGNVPGVSRRMDFALVTLLVLAAAGIRLYFLQFYTVISADGVSYLAIASDFVSGHGLGAASHYPPFYPMLIGLASPLFDTLENAGLAVAIAMGSLIAIPVYLLGMEFFDRKVGFMAAALSISWPTLRYWSTAVMSQSTYITLVLFGVYFVWRGYRKGSFLPCIVAGVCFASAHLTRSEGVLVLFGTVALLALFTFMMESPHKRLLCLLLTLAVFFLLYSPYLVMLHELTGKWQLTGKTRITIADALSAYLGKPDLKHDPQFREVDFLDLFRLYPEYIRSNYLNNLSACWRQLLPAYLWVLAGLGVILGVVNREKLLQRCYLLATFAPLAFIVVFFFIGPEYTQPYLPVLFLFIANGVSWSVTWVGQRVREGWGERGARILGYLPVGLALLLSVGLVLRSVPSNDGRPYDPASDGGRFAEKQIGLKLAQTLPKDAVLMTRSGRIGFYSTRPFLMPPQADYPTLVRYARSHGVDYLLVTMQLLQLRPQLEFLYDPLLYPGRPFSPPPELELVSVVQEPGGLPYILYRIKE
jgi:4-amino-4-deoxy-L-arabinose transferase-like glycosyltransferase